MELSSLEDLLEVKYAACGGRVVLPRDAWERLKERTDADGTTLLMKAARDGSRECVELLLWCGVDVNEKRRVEGAPERAIEFAIDRGHCSIVKILLQWDSILPDPLTMALCDKLHSIEEVDETVRELLLERNELHERVRRGDLQEIKEILSHLDDQNRSGPRYWVDENGCSLLYSAAIYRRHDIWALLKSRKFEYLEKEIGKINTMFRDDEFRCQFDRAMGKYFTEVDDCHIHKLLSKTKVRGGCDDAELKIQKIYHDANKVPEARLLMECLQDDPYLEVIFDLERSDITCVYSWSTSAVRGVTDPKLKRVYASASLETHTQVVSNFVHELCHRVLYNVFMNCGLPYKNTDCETIIVYDEIASTILFRENLKYCNEVIKLVKLYPEETQHQELIVRVPEILTKHKLDGMGGKSPWMTQNEENLASFYSFCVEPEIRRFIAANHARLFIPTVDLFSHPELLSKQKKNYAQVAEIETPKFSSHHGVRFLQVSNLTLGVNHLEKTCKNLVAVDWSVFAKSETYFETNLMRGNIPDLAIVWDEEMGSSFCEDPGWCRKSCPANRFQKHEQYVVLLIPKDFNVHQHHAPIDYMWEHLSEETKSWVLCRHVNFQGRDVVLKDVISGAMGNEQGDASMNALVDEQDVSWLIDRDTLTFGGQLETDLAKRRHNLLRQNPQSFIPRRITVRPIDFKDVMWRDFDAVFIFNTRESCLREHQINDARPWNGAIVPDEEARYFLLYDRLIQSTRLAYCKDICKELRDLSTAPRDWWLFAHFYRYELNNFTHVYSQRVHDVRCLLVADDPGSGKSVLVNIKAAEEKGNNPERWIEVVQLTECEDILATWSDHYVTQSGKFEDFLYRLISNKTRNNEDLPMVKKIFQILCRVVEKVTIYFDGFDEICPVYKEYFSSFLKALLKNTSVSFVVTTRKEERADLEDRLSTLAYALVPFDKEEQVLFINREWNAMLNSMPKTEREDKIKAIAKKYESCGYFLEDYHVLHNEDGYDMLHHCIVKGLGSSQDTDFKREDFYFKLASEALIENGKSLIDKEGYFSEIPLHTWMLAAVSFQQDLFLENSVSLTFLYHRFVDLKIELYSSEKAKHSGLVAGTSMKKLFVSSMWKMLKKFSVLFFLQNKNCQPHSEEIRDMQRVGLVVEREFSVEFIHRTFGEYLLSLWLIEKMEDVSVMKILLDQVLLDDQFAKVRKFLDGLLLSEDDIMPGENSKPAENNFLPEGHKFVASIRNCFLTAISENRKGILAFLVELSGESRTDVMFGEAYDYLNIYKHLRWRVPYFERRNSFTICGALVYCSDILEKVECVKLLQNVLLIAESNCLIDHLGHLISKEGLWWTGIIVHILWKEDNGLEMFRWIFNFLLKHKKSLKKPLRQYLMCEESARFFKYASRYDFSLLEQLMETILNKNDFRKLLAPSWLDRHYKSNNNLVSAWISVVSNGSLSDVKRVWKFLESKLTQKKMRKTFLQRKDKWGWNGLFAAFSNSCAPYVVSYVWELIKSEFGEGKCKEIAFEIFFDVVEKLRFQWFTDFFMNWLSSVLNNGYLHLGQVKALMRIQNEFKVRSLLSIHSEFSPFSLHKMQVILENAFTDEAEKLWSHEILNCMEGEYAYLAPSCFSFKRNDSLPLTGSMIHGEFERILPHLMATGLLNDVFLDLDYSIRGISDETGSSIPGYFLLEYLTLLWRQMELEVKHFSVDYLVARVKNEWLQMYKNFPVFRIKSGCSPIGSRCFIIPYFFSVLLHFLSKEKVSEFILHGDKVNVSAFWIALGGDWLKPLDTMSFLALYDVARLCMGEEALCRIHSLSDGQEGIILSRILRTQDEGLFEKPVMFINDSHMSHNMTDDHSEFYSLLSSIRECCSSEANKKYLVSQE
ncbi:uncharacterized protein LOC124169378 [Ischnura elegans]|uniref:uncharacterized protein LOC124169378 n=1 Tax=Ischnura elegans TaxID=197161 RepID=UPI001ED8A92C|nr:uncharacterized protein LOC124169378 [Ischnura elegans]